MCSRESSRRACWGSLSANATPRAWFGVVGSEEEKGKIQMRVRVKAAVGVGDLKVEDLVIEVVFLE